MGKVIQIKLEGTKHWKLKHEENAIMFIKSPILNYMLCISLISKWVTAYDYLHNHFNLRSAFRRLGANLGKKAMEQYISGYQGQLSDFIDSETGMVKFIAIFFNIIQFNKCWCIVGINTL